MALLIALILAAPVLARLYIHCSTRSRVFAKVSEIPNHRVALVLGAGVRGNGQPSELLADRLDGAVALYMAGRVEKLLMSGDNRVSRYNEPERMREYAVAHGVPAEDVKCDYAGRRTYDSVYRARNIFGLRKLVVISQGFHLPRALFLCDAVGVEACGLSADRRRNTKSEIREYIASVSALFDVYIRRPKPVMGKREPI